MSKRFVFKLQKLLFRMLKNFSAFNLPKNIQNGKTQDSLKIKDNERD